MHYFLKFIFGIKLYTHVCFGQFFCPSELQDQDGTRSILILLVSFQQTCMTYTISVCTVKNS